MAVAIQILNNPNNDVRVDHFLIWPGPYSGANIWGGINLSAEYLMIARLPRLAGTIVHEATHLKIRQRGISYHPSLRERIKRAILWQTMLKISPRSCAR